MLSAGQPYMAPEIVLESGKSASATLEDMKAIDVWALRMTLFSILNPDTSFPIETELKSTFPTIATGPAQFQTLLQDKMEGKLKPSSRIYHRLQASLCINIEKIFEICTDYNASLRPSTQDVLQQLKTSNANCNPGKHISLKVSQSTPIKEADRKLAEAIEQCTSDAVTELVAIVPANDGTNAYTFLCLVTAQKLFDVSQKGRMNDNWPEMVPRGYSRKSLFTT